MEEFCCNQWYQGLRLYNVYHKGRYIDKEVPTFINRAAIVGSPVIQRCRYDQQISSAFVYPVPFSTEEPDLIVRKAVLRLYSLCFPHSWFASPRSVAITQLPML